ncbi:MAG: TerC family protein, partial [Caulobacteraceae bacterium]
FGVHVPKGYIYAAMAFSAGVEALNMMGRRGATKKEQAERARSEANAAEVRAQKAEAEAAAEKA